MITLEQNSNANIRAWQAPLAPRGALLVLNSELRGTARSSRSSARAASAGPRLLRLLAIGVGGSISQFRESFNCKRRRCQTAAAKGTRVGKGGTAVCVQLESSWCAPEAGGCAAASLRACARRQHRGDGRTRVIGLSGMGTAVGCLIEAAILPGSSCACACARSPTAAAGCGTAAPPGSAPCCRTPIWRARDAPHPMSRARGLGAGESFGLHSSLCGVSRRAGRCPGQLGAVRKRQRKCLAQMLRGRCTTDSNFEKVRVSQRAKMSTFQAPRASS